MMRAAAGAPLARPRLLLLIVGGVVTASVAAVLMGPRPEDHQALADLSLPAIIGAGILDGFNPCAFGVLILFATFAANSIQSAAASNWPSRNAASAKSSRPSKCSEQCQPTTRLEVP